MRMNAYHLLNAPSWLLKLDRRPERLLGHLKCYCSIWSLLAGGDCFFAVCPLPTLGKSIRAKLCYTVVFPDAGLKSLILNSPLYDVCMQNRELMLQWTQWLVWSLIQILACVGRPRKNLPVIWTRLIWSQATWSAWHNQSSANKAALAELKAQYFPATSIVTKI